MARVVSLFFAVGPGTLCAAIVYFECDVLPEDAGWERLLGGTAGADRGMGNGWLTTFVDLPEGWPGPKGNAEFYERPLGPFVGDPAFFIEWRAETDAPSAILETSGVPTVLSAGGSGPAFYHTTMTDTRVQLYRDTTIPLIYVDIEPCIPHTYRVELHEADSYAWYIDGELANCGVPEGSYPSPDSVVIWGVRRIAYDTTARWDYVRYGHIPSDASGDFDSDEDVDRCDFYFFHECLTNERPGINGGPENDAGPGCRFADFDADADVDLSDVAVFQQVFSGGD